MFSSMMAACRSTEIAPRGSQGTRPRGPLLRIVHVAPNIARAFGGPTEAIAGWARAAAVAGHDVKVLAPHVADEELAWFRRQATGVQVSTFPLRGRPPLLVTPGLYRRILREADAADIVHVHGLLNLVSSLAARAAVRAGIPLVIDPFGTLSAYTFGHRHTASKRLYFALFDRSLLPAAAALHYYSADERAEAERMFGDKVLGRGWVVPPAIPREAETMAPRRQGKGARVLFLSRIDPKKGIETLLEAWPTVLERFPAARLIIAGGGGRDYAASVRARVLQMGARAATIDLAGFLSGEAKRAAFAAADVFVLPSFAENFGIVVLEAMAAGLPVVITPEVQLAPYVRRHGLGLITSREPGSLAEAIDTALTDTELRRRAADVAPELVRRDFALAAVERELLDMYRATLPPRVLRS
ncbi:MAG TPA: glycosyltransferase [Gemmatimonadaceae bacterium]